MYLDTTWQSLYYIHSKYYLKFFFFQVDFGAKCDLCFHEILPFTAILLGFIKTSQTPRFVRVRSVGITITQKRGRCVCVTGNTPGEPAASPSVLKGTRECFYCPPAQRAKPPASLEPDAMRLLHCTHAAKTTCTMKRLQLNCSGSSQSTLSLIKNEILNIYRRLQSLFPHKKHLRSR